MNENIIERALKFYDIDDIFYKNNCIECLKFMEKKTSFKNKVYDLCDILYNKKDYLIAKLWKLSMLEELFDNDYHPYVTSVIILFGYDIHQKNMIKYKLDDKQILIHKKRVKETLLNDIFIRNLKSVRITQMLWASYFINLRIVEVGSLQYELVSYNPITNEKECCVKIHIPRGANIKLNMVIDSIKKSKDKIKQYFSKENIDYYCESWILSDGVLNLLDDDSNIKKFSSIFNIISGNDCNKDILNFVFDDVYCKDYKLLKEDTLLQRKLKNILINNGIIKIGIGKLKESIK